MTEKTYCPVHGDPTRPGHEWPCPVATTRDPEDAETCPHFVEEMRRRIEGVKAGNYWAMERDDDGRFFAEYKNGQPTGVVNRFPHPPG